MSNYSMGEIMLNPALWASSSLVVLVLRLIFKTHVTPQPHLNHRQD